MRYKPFYKKVDIRKPKDMVDYLKNHFRYDTMNSWNRATSYANNVKIHNVIPHKLQDKAYVIMEQGDVYYEINDLLSGFGVSHDYEYQVGFNGRSGGYVVLYKGGKEPSGYKTKCDFCRRLTWYEEEQPCHVSGCNGTLKILTQPHYKIYTQPGKGIDMDADYEDWDIEELRNRVKLVREFDRLCDDVVNLFIDYCRNFNVQEKEIKVPKTIKVLVESTA